MTLEVMARLPARSYGYQGRGRASLPVFVFASVDSPIVLEYKVEF